MNLYTGKPSLQHLKAPIRYPEGFELRVTLEAGPTAHPFPSTYQWTGSQDITIDNDTRRMFGYPYLTISSVQSPDSGEYSLSANNTLPEDQINGVGSGSFTLDVLCKLLIVSTCSVSYYYYNCLVQNLMLMI